MLHGELFVIKQLATVLACVFISNAQVGLVEFHTA